MTLPFADLVRRKMGERGLGLRELCRSAGIDPSFLSKVLAGKRSPPSEEAALRKLGAALEIDAVELIVAAGRIPSEWSRLWTDRKMFDSVHHLASGVPTRPSATERSREGVPPPRAVRARPPQTLGEELL